MHPLRLAIASTQEEKAAAAALIIRVYQRTGYIREGISEERSVLFLPGTTTFVVYLEGVMVGTISVLTDTTLPMDSLFSDILNPLRETGAKIAEVGQFAVDRELVAAYQKTHPTEATDRQISFTLFKLALNFGLKEKLGVFCITVNPKHESFYAALGFTRFGETRDYASVQNAPAVPMQLALGSPLANANAVLTGLMSPLTPSESAALSGASSPGT